MTTTPNKQLEPQEARVELSRLCQDRGIDPAEVTAVWESGNGAVLQYVEHEVRCGRFVDEDGALALCDDQMKMLRLGAIATGKLNEYERRQDEIGNRWWELAESRIEEHRNPHPLIFDPGACLPAAGFLADFVRMVANQGGPEPLGAAAAYATLGATCAPHFYYQDGFMERSTNGYYMGIAPSGSGKLLADSLRARILEQHSDERVQDRIGQNIGTGSGLMDELMERAGRSVLCSYEESSIFYEKLSGSGNEGYLGFILKAYGTLDRFTDRTRRQGRREIVDGHLSLLCFSALEPLMRVWPRQSFESGLVARHLLLRAHPGDAKPQRIPTNPQAVQEGLEGLRQHLSALLDFADEHSDGTRPYPRVRMTFDAEAEQLLREIDAEMAALCASEEDCRVRPTLERAGVHIRVLAMLNRLSQSPITTTVALDDIQAATNLFRISLSETRLLTREAPDGKFQEKLLLVRQALERAPEYYEPLARRMQCKFITGPAGPYSWRSLLRIDRRLEGTTPNVARALLETLEADGLITLEGPRNRRGGGKLPLFTLGASDESDTGDDYED